MAYRLSFIYERLMRWKGNETERKKMFYNYFLVTKAAMKEPR